MNRSRAEDQPAAPPPGAPAIRVLAMPADTNPNGDIFGGWLMAQMDIAGAVVAVQRARGRVVTIGVEAMEFRKTVNVGDLLSFYGEIERVGRTSVRVCVQAWARRARYGVEELVTTGTYTYVAVADDGRPRPVDAEPAA